jgi:hypothetical protein
MTSIPRGFKQWAKYYAALWAEEKGVSRRTRHLAALWAYQEEQAMLDGTYIYSDRKHAIKDRLYDMEDSQERRELRHQLSFIRWYWHHHECEECEKIEVQEPLYIRLPPQYPI